MADKHTGQGDAIAINYWIEGVGFKITIADIGISEELIIESGVDGLGTLQIGFRNFGAGQIGARKIGVWHDRFIQVSIAEIELAHVDFPKSDPPFDGLLLAAF
jgi:hypothetical protein